MKQFIRAITLVLLVGGWALASAAVHVIRTPGQTFPTIITKDHLLYKDTYVDTRAWTLVDDRAHSEVVARLIHLDETSLLAHTVNTNSGPVETQLMAAIGMPSKVTLLGNNVKTNVDLAKAKSN